MTSMKNQSKLPKWFQGELYTEGDTVKNPFSGEEYKLNAEELSMYDFIKGAEFTINVNGVFNPETSGIQKDMMKALDWFRSTNARAYMVLLD